MLLSSDLPPAITVEDVWVRYKTSYERKPTVKKALVSLGRRQRTTRSVEALKGVRFIVGRGAVVGIIGSNGAGKSTLLRTIAGILPPAEGRVTVRGKVATLLALGVGFNKDLTGRDNVMLGGMAYGLTRDEVRERFDEIAEFSELGDYIDAPIRSYSSGMRSRLGFAVAVHLESDILLIDEALSAGDAAFKQKCLDKVRELTSAEHRTVLIVSHGLHLIEELANSCLWLEQGEIRKNGGPGEVIDEYMAFKKVGRTAAAMEDV